MGNARTLDTGTDFLLAEVTDGVATLSFNRPDRRNALHHEVFAAFGKVLPELAVAEDVGAIVVTGVGNSFSAGGDVRAQADRAERAATGQLAQTSEGRVDELRRNQRAVSLALHNHPKVTIAALPGAAAGAGSVDRARLRPAHRCSVGVRHDRIRQGRVFRRLRRQLVPHPAGRRSQGPRART